MRERAFDLFNDPTAALNVGTRGTRPGGGGFSRLFGWMPPHVPDPKDKEPREALLDLAKRLYDDGACAKDRGGKKAEKGAMEEGKLNPGFPAAYAFIAQFIAHDLSFDPSTPGQVAPEDASMNARTPRFDLDVVYGGNPDQNLDFYELLPGNRNTYRFRFGKTTGPRQYDFPRDGNLALIPDQRDDQHVIISQFHVAMMKLHNQQLEQVMKRHPKGTQATLSDFLEAQRLTRWHYQYAIVHDFLPRMLGERQNQAILQPELERWSQRITRMTEQPTRRAAVPLEFSVAIYRIGHSVIRAAYRINGKKLGQLPLFPASAVTTVSPAAAGVPPAIGGGPPAVDGAASAATPTAAAPASAALAVATAAPSRTGAPQDLSGGRPLHKDLVVSWEYMFRTPGRERRVQNSRTFRNTLPKAFSAIRGLEKVGGLAGRDLERGWLLGLPSGQDVAHRLGIESDLFKPGNDSLWYYAMREVPDSGLSVGPVSARILCKVFLDLLQLDPGSYLCREPNWYPPSVKDEKESFRYLVKGAGMPFG